jgi:hypothetical protein
MTGKPEWLFAAAPARALAIARQQVIASNDGAVLIADNGNAEYGMRRRKRRSSATTAAPIADPGRCALQAESDERCHRRLA